MEIPERQERLRSLELFRQLPASRLEELARGLGVERHLPGAMLFEEGSVGDTMYLVAEGRIRIEKRVEAGGVKELAVLSTGDLFGEMALLERMPRSARATADTDVIVFTLTRETLAAWLRADLTTAVGYFVELLRVSSQRLRRLSQELVLLHDLSHLALDPHAGEAEFVTAALHRMVPHLDGDWSGAAYLYNEFNDEVWRVTTDGPAGDILPESLPIAEARNRWLDAGTFCVALPGRTSRPLGFLVARNARPMTDREQAAFTVTLAAAAQLVSSALLNIRHEAEERLRARLQRQLG